MSSRNESELSKRQSRSGFFEVLPRARIESARPSYVEYNFKLPKREGRNVASVAMTTEEYDLYI